MGTTMQNSSANDTSEFAEPRQPACNRTWVPILVGVIGGFVACFVVAQFESPPFYSVTSRALGETSPKAMFIHPGYPWVMTAILICFAGAGGAIGIRYSKWRLMNSVIFLSAVLLAIAGCALWTHT